MAHSFAEITLNFCSAISEKAKRINDIKMKAFTVKEKNPGTVRTSTLEASLANTTILKNIMIM
jgi:hypothetical protein